MNNFLQRLKKAPTPVWVGAVIALAFALLLALGGCRCQRAYSQDLEQTPEPPTAHAEKLEAVGEFVAGGPTHAGETITTHLREDKHVKNTGGSDGAGLCVFNSMRNGAMFQNLRTMEGIFDWMKKHPGGGYPEKVDKMLAKYAQEKGVKVPEYLQHTGGEMDVLKLALKTGRMPCVTYAGQDNVFYRSGIDHMVNLVHLSEKWAVILDNNNPGKYLWMTPKDFETRWKARGGGWAFIWLEAPPSPVPSPVKVQALGEARVWEDGDAPRTFGLDRSKMTEGTTYTLSGKSITREEALALVGGSLSDDSQKGTLTAYGSPDFLTAIDRLLESPEMAPYKAKLHYQRYASGDWDAAQIGLAEGLTLQGARNAEGKAPVIWRFRSIPTASQLVEALREKDPNYKPENDPDPTKKPQPAPANPNQPAPTPRKIPLPCLAFLALIIFAGWRYRERILPNANRAS